jgi:hypothetical protein
MYTYIHICLFCSLGKIIIQETQNNARRKGESEDANKAKCSCTSPPGHVSGGGGRVRGNSALL